MKKVFIMAVLITVTMHLNAQQGEIIYTDFDPDLALHVGSYPRDTIWVDFDNDNMSDIFIYHWFSSPSVGVQIVCCNQTVKICRAEEDCDISLLEDWKPNEFYPHLQENYAIRIEKEGMPYYGWFRTYTVFEPFVVNDFCFDKYAFCTIPNYPLLWGQTSLIGVEENRVPNPFATLFPNPAQDLLRMQYSPDVKPAQVELYDLQGRLVRTQSQGLESINLQGLVPGQYLMQVTLEEGKSYSDKVVKE